MKYSVYAFDFDGTLVDSNTLKSETFFQTIEHLGVEARQLMEELLTRPDRGNRYWAYEKFSQAWPGEKQNPQALADDYNRRSQAGIKAAAEIPGTLSCLQELQKQGASLYVNSATPEAAVQESVQNKNWQHFFRGVYGGPRTKAQNLQTILELEKCQVQDILMVGDSQMDLDAAQEFGCDFLGIVIEKGRFSTPPNWAISSFLELPLLADIKK